MRVIMESAFDVVYLIGVIGMGVVMLTRRNKDSVGRYYGWMAIILGVGDAFHLVPRIAALLSAGPSGDVAKAFLAYQVPMGFGKAVTSITMTMFYLMLYRIWCIHYDASRTTILTIFLVLLAGVRVWLSVLPQNQWLVADQPLEWGIYRNIPFLIMGFVMIAIFYAHSKGYPNDPFKWMWVAITLSFAFYIPVVLWSDVNVMIGMLMIPKTLAYVWIVKMGLNYTKRLN